MKCVVPAVVSSLCFALSVTKVTVKNGKTKSLRLVAVPTGAYSTPGAKIIADLKDYKTRVITYSASLENILKNNNWDNSVLDPIKEYLCAQLKAGKKNPEPFVAMLDSILKSGSKPTFTVSF